MNISLVYRTIRDVMHNKANKYLYAFRSAHIKWRINQMEPSRRLRKLFPKLPGTPDWWSASTEKFIFIDEPNAPSYVLVWILIIMSILFFT